MKRRLISALVLAISVIGARVIEARAVMSAPDTATAQAQVNAADSAVGRAIRTRDYASLGRYWSPLLVVNSPDNRIADRSQVIASMHKGGLNYVSLKGTTESFSLFDGVAIKMMHEEVVMADGPMAGKHLVRRSTNVLQRSGDDWVLIARQATYIGFDGAILAGPANNSYSNPPVTARTNVIKTQIEANNRAVGRAIGAMDFGALEKLWSPRMVVNSPGNNILDREQLFAAIRDDKLRYSSVSGAVEAFFVSRDVAVEMGHENIVMSNGPMAGKALTRRYTDVWQKTGDNWVQIARQATYIGIDGGAVYGHPDAALNS